MLQTANPPGYSLRKRSLETVEKVMADRGARDDAPASDDDADDIGGKGQTRSKSRRELPAGAVATLKAWLLSPEHFTHPYPTPQDQAMLMQKTGIDKKQLKNWFTNARRRIWKPMLKKQLEQGKLTVTGAGGGGVAVPGVMPGLMVPNMPGGITGQTNHDVTVQQGMQVHYQQALQPQPQPQHIPAQPESQAPADSYAQSLFLTPGGPAVAAAAAASAGSRQVPSVPPYYDPTAVAMAPGGGPAPAAAMPAAGNPLSKTDSHAVLMELFARDQDLVKQATESAGLKTADASDPAYPTQTVSSGDQQSAVAPGSAQQAPSQQVSHQHPMRIPSQGRLVNVPTLNSWPHFSSVSSLNNLSTMPGVKSITSLSGVDLANQGPVNRVGNLAQVKSVESMGKNDSYAFLEVFFGDRSSAYGGGKDQRGVKRQREEDNDVGLSLEDEGPSTTLVKQETSMPAPAPLSFADGTSSMFTTSSAQETSETPSTLKRAYDDALAAHGLISVSRSCEKLTDLALPAKIQRTLSREYLSSQQQHEQDKEAQIASADSGQTEQASSSIGKVGDSQQYASSMHSGQVSQEQGKQLPIVQDTKGVGASVEVPLTTKCAICHQTNVDTQLRPCGHMFHERCLKPTLQTAIGAPKCPVDHIAMHSALLAIPTDEPGANTNSSLQLSATWNKEPEDNQGVSSEV